MAWNGLERWKEGKGEGSPNIKQKTMVISGNVARKTRGTVNNFDSF